MAKENPKCSRYDLRALEQWLAEQAANGKWLGEEWLEFTDAEPVTRRFYIEPAQERGGPTQALRDARALAGWEFVCTMDKEAFLVWRSVGERAKLPRMREMPDSWAYRRLGRKIIGGALTSIAILPIILLPTWFATKSSPLPLRALLTDNSTQLTLLTMVLTVVCGIFAANRDARNILRLRRAIRAGEYQQPVAQHRAWYGAMQKLPMIASIVVLVLLLVASQKNSFIDMQKTPFLPAEALGGTEASSFAEQRRAPLCDLTIVHEGDWDSWTADGRWWSTETQLEVYHLCPGLLAGPLADEIIHYYGMEQVELLDGNAGAFYGSGAAEHQAILLCRGGRVLFYRTNAPEDLRQHLGEFVQLLEEYEKR